MNRTATKTALATAVALSTAFAAQTATADLITEWSYQANSTFSDFTQTSGAGSVSGGAPNGVLGGNTSLTWGDQEGGPGSSISAQPTVTDPPLLETNDPDGVAGSTFTHDNDVIPSGSSELDTFELQTQLNLTAESPSSGEAQQVGPVTFDSFFVETFNESDIGDCVEGSTSACDDIFVLADMPGDSDPLAPGESFSVEDSFTIDDFDYTVFLEIDDLTTLTDAQCAEAGAAAGCVGFLTEENTDNTFGSRFRIEATQAEAVPEPASLVLFGLGLVGLGYARRRSNNA